MAVAPWAIAPKISVPLKLEIISLRVLLAFRLCTYGTLWNRIGGKHRKLSYNYGVIDW